MPKKLLKETDLDNLKSESSTDTEPEVVAEVAAADAVEDAARALSDAKGASIVDQGLVNTLTQAKEDADAALEAAEVSSDAVDARVTERTTNAVASDVYAWHYANELSNTLGDQIGDLDDEIAERQTQATQATFPSFSSGGNVDNSKNIQVDLSMLDPTGFTSGQIAVLTSIMQRVILDATVSI